MKKLTTEEFIQKAKLIHGDKYDYSLVNYTGGQIPVKIICPEHGIFEQRPAKHIFGQGCPKCNGTRLKTTEEFIKQAKEVHGDTYDYSKTEYGKNNRDPVIIICKLHGEFKQTPVHHINCKCGCPKCNMSHGEQILLQYFIKNNIKYIEQYEVTVPSTIRKTKKIYIDFYLPEYNTYIEYNGKQHYIMQEGFGGTLKFEQQVSRDIFLRNYCINNNIKLIEIPYTEKDPINYLINFLK